MLAYETKPIKTNYTLSIYLPSSILRYLSKRRELYCYLLNGKITYSLTPPENPTDTPPIKLTIRLTKKKGDSTYAVLTIPQPIRNLLGITLNTPLQLIFTPENMSLQIYPLPQPTQPTQPTQTTQTTQQ